MSRAVDRGAKVVLQAVRAAYRAAKKKLGPATDPASSLMALTETWQETDAVAKTIVKKAEEALAADEEPDQFVEDGKWFACVLRSDDTHWRVRGPVPVRRTLFRSRRRGIRGYATQRRSRLRRPGDGAWCPVRPAGCVLRETASVQDEAARAWTGVRCLDYAPRKRIVRSAECDVVSASTVFRGREMQ